MTLRNLTLDQETRAAPIHPRNLVAVRRLHTQPLAKSQSIHPARGAPDADLRRRAIVVLAPATNAGADLDVGVEESADAALSKGDEVVAVDRQGQCLAASAGDVAVDRE